MSQNENPVPSTHNQRVQSDSGANAAHVNESSQNENAAPRTRNQCLQSGRGQTGRIRNRCTSYEMVERSLNAQDRLIDQNNRNNSESVHMFTAAVNGFSTAMSALTEVLREYLNR
ncbi:hypothetical protein Bhyg_09641, partial [Pseudolycoriella hygida]